jgi:hypothetical protein
MATSGKAPETGLGNDTPIRPIGNALELSSPKANRLVRLVAPRTNEQQRLKAACRLANFREPHETDVEQFAVAFQQHAVLVRLVILGVRFEEGGVEVLKDIHAAHVIKL